MRETGRFRADPALVRVGVRKHKKLWYCVITSRDGSRGPVEAMHIRPWGAVNNALVAADTLGIPGIDLGMDWVYDHPQFTKAKP